MSAKSECSDHHLLFDLLRGGTHHQIFQDDGLCFRQVEFVSDPLEGIRVIGIQRRHLDTDPG